GADVSRTDARGCTPLHLAVLEGNEELTRLLLSAGANPNARIKDTAPEPQPCEGETPLHIAALRCSTNLMSALLAAGGHVNATKQDGLTPLGLLHSDRSIVAPGGVRYFRPAARYQAMGYIAVDFATSQPEELKKAKLYLIGQGALTNSASLKIPQNGTGPV